MLPKVRIETGQDRHPRVAKVQVGDKTVVRSIHKLVPLFKASLVEII